ncbi:MAG: AMP-dependent synthetase/ligase [Fibrobacterota bacterium]
MRKLIEFDRIPVFTIKEMLYATVSRYSKRNALMSKVSGKWVSVTYESLLERVNNAGAALYAMGVCPGDRVAVLGENNTNWAVAYLAAACGAVTVVPIDKELTAQEVRRILKVSECQGIFISSNYFHLIEELNIPDFVVDISLNNNEDQSREGVIPMDDFIENGRQNAKNCPEIGYDQAEVKPDDPLSMLFTSGTIGASKAVCLTHKNVCSNFTAAARSIMIYPEDVFLSVLPIHHVYENTCGFLLPLYAGSKIAFAESLRKIPDNLKEIKPTVLLAVPLLINKLYKKIKAGIKAKGAEKKAGAVCSLLSLFGEYAMPLKRKVFREIHDKFGGRIRLFVVGGAAMDPDTAYGMGKFGFKVLQGYGLSETSPLLAVNRENFYKHDAAGLPVPGVSIRIDNPDKEGIGEVLAKGPNIMSGYYKNESATKSVFTPDGWFRTGDLGSLDEDGFLLLCGRKKLVIVTPNGKNVFPEEIEDELVKKDCIMEAMVWPGGSKDMKKHYVHATIVPDMEFIDAEFDKKNIEITEENIYREIKKVIKELNEKMADYKRITRFNIRKEEFPKTSKKTIKRYLVSIDEQSV